jgi:DNA gyrase inhibitor GyrI
MATKNLTREDYRRRIARAIALIAADPARNPGLEGAYRWLNRDWLPASGQDPADQPAREEYLNDPRSLPPAEWQTAVMLPLRPGA